MTQDQTDFVLSHGEEIIATNMFVAMAFLGELMPQVMNIKGQSIFVGKDKEKARVLQNNCIVLSDRLFRNVMTEGTETELMHSRTETTFFKLIQKLTQMGPLEQDIFVKIADRITVAPETRNWNISLHEIYSEINAEWEASLNDRLEKESKWKLKSAGDGNDHLHTAVKK